MQKVLAQFVESTGHSVMGVGSWISGTSFNPASSDFDMRLVISQGGTEAQQLARWQQARGQLANLIRQEFGSEAGSILSRANLYAPNQLMRGVENPADALERFQKLNTVPNLAHTGPVTSSTAGKFTEGLYGSGSQTYVQGYERASGRLFYSNNGKCVTGLSELAHMGEGAPIYTAAGSANTAGQWAEHCLDELRAGRGDKVAKYLERLERDLIKSRSLSGLPIDEAYRSELKAMREMLKASPGKLTSVADDVAALVARGRAEAAILGGFEKAGPVRQAYLRVMLDGVALKNQVGQTLDKIMAKIPNGVDAENTMNFIVFCLGTKAASESLGQGDDVFETLANVCGAVNPLRMIGPVLLAEVMANIITEAKAGGYDMAAGFQGAWDLMEGIYTAWGRAGVDPDPRRKLTLADLVAIYQYEEHVGAMVMAMAIRASTRGLGTANEQHDQGVAEAIFDECWPTIRDAWRWQRDILASEYLKLGSEVVHTPLVIYYKPAEPKTGEKIICEAISADRKLGERLERMRQIIRILYGCGSGIAVNYYWKPTGEAVSERGWQRSVNFDQPGKHPVKVSLEIAPYTRHTKTEPRVMLRRELPALVDIVVAGDPKPPAVKLPNFACETNEVMRLFIPYKEAFTWVSCDLTFTERCTVVMKVQGAGPSTNAVSPGASSNPNDWTVPSGIGYDEKSNGRPRSDRFDGLAVPAGWRRNWNWGCQVSKGQSYHFELNCTMNIEPSSATAKWMTRDDKGSCAISIQQPKFVVVVNHTMPDKLPDEKEVAGSKYGLDYSPVAGESYSLNAYALVEYTATFSSEKLPPKTVKSQERVSIASMILECPQ